MGELLWKVLFEIIWFANKIVLWPLLAIVYAVMFFITIKESFIKYDFRLGRCGSIVTSIFDMGHDASRQVRENSASRLICLAMAAMAHISMWGISGESGRSFGQIVWNEILNNHDPFWLFLVIFTALLYIICKIAQSLLPHEYDKYKEPFKAYFHDEIEKRHAKQSS